MIRAGSKNVGRLAMQLLTRQNIDAFQVKKHFKSKGHRRGQSSRPD
jgi:hypothetical protein